MELERLNLELRRRSPWEAADLGLIVLRRWPGAVYRAWFATFVPFMLLLFLLLWPWPMLAAFIGWWSKPLFDRVLLKVYSEAVFDAPPSVRTVWRALPGLVRDSDLLRGLTLGRADMARSFHLPIRQLEKQRGAAAKARHRVLDRKAHGGAVWLTFLCAHMSAFFQLSLILLLDFFWPREAPPVFDWEALFRGETGPWQSFLSHLAWLCGETLVEPFYVAAGFTLYLNRRNELEGWDIELGFRRLARRVETERNSVAVRRTAVLAALGLAGCLLGSFPSGSVAEPFAGEGAEQLAAAAPRAGDQGGDARKNSTASEAKRTIQAVLADPVFGREIPDWRWRYRDDGEDDEPSSSDSGIGAMAQWLAEWIAKGIRLLGFVGAAVLAAVLIVLLYRYRDAWRLRRPATRAIPATLFGLDVRPESLPADITGVASRLLAAGEFAAALSLLYRGALVSLIHAARVEFRPGDTESDCQVRVRGRIDGAAERYFAELLDAWMLTAYAHAALPTERLQDLCARWACYFATVERSAS